MDTLDTYRQLIQKILTEYAQIPYAHGDIQIEPVFDSESDRYLLIILGRPDEFTDVWCTLTSSMTKCGFNAMARNTGFPTNSSRQEFRNITLF